MDKPTLHALGLVMEQLIAASKSRDSRGPILTAMHQLREVLEEAAPVKIGHVNPAAKLSHRTRFFVEWASEYGIRVSALIFLVAACGRKTRGTWHQSAAWFGRQLGVSTQEGRRLLKKAKAAGLITRTATGRGLRVTLAEKIFKQAIKLMHREQKHGSFDLRLARVLGSPERAIVYNIVREVGKDDDVNNVFTANSVAHYCPYLSHTAARKILERLKKQGAIERKPSSKQRRAGLYHADWLYFWSKKRRTKRIFCARKSSGQLDHSAGQLKYPPVNSSTLLVNSSTLKSRTKPYIVDPLASLVGSTPAFHAKAKQEPFPHTAAPCVRACGAGLDFLSGKDSPANANGKAKRKKGASGPTVSGSSNGEHEQ